jgi:uncharacterized protein YqgC (DUF456 family)
MSTDQIIGLILALLLMGVGTAGAVLPGVPSTPLVLVAAIAHKLYFGVTGVGWMVMTLLVGLTALSLAMDYVATVYGAKRLGATWRGAVGAVVGGVIGIFFHLPGLLLGPFAGAFLFEKLGGRTWKDSGRAGLGATIGLLAGALGKLTCCVAMIGLFTANVIYRSLS